jgi:hypothetical protein
MLIILPLLAGLPLQVLRLVTGARALISARQYSIFSAEAIDSTGRKSGMGLTG